METPIDALERRCGVDDAEWDSDKCTCTEEINPWNGRIVSIDQLCSYCALFFGYLADFTEGVQ